MKNLLNLRFVCLSCTLLISSLTYAQSFEGTITYRNDFTVSKKFQDMGLTKEILQAELKKKDTWFDTCRISYKQGDYIFTTPNNLKKIYKADVNKIYTFETQDGEELCSVQEGVDLDLKGQPDKPQVIELDSTATIMGVTCKIIRMKWKISQVDFYYNADQAKVNPALFAKHSYEGFSEFVSRTKCLPLQIVRNAIGMTLIQTAVRVKPMEIKSDVFVIPALEEDEDLNILKMPGLKIMRVKK